MTIKLNDILNIPTKELKDYKIKTNMSKHFSLLDAYYYDKQAYYNYANWRKHNDKKVAYSLQNDKYVIQFISNNKYKQFLFTGIFKVIGIKQNYNNEGEVYDLEEVEEFSKYVGRLVVEFDKPSNYNRKILFDAGKKINNNSDVVFIDCFNVVEILDSEYQGIEFKGYDNVILKYSDLKNIINSQNSVWKTALSSFKGIYVQIDSSNGKLYVGKADGNQTIWQRWHSYVQSYHGGNKKLIKLFDEKGKEHFEKHFSYSILETLPKAASDDVINSRESYWKEMLDTRSHGYNDN